MNGSVMSASKTQPSYFKMLFDDVDIIPNSHLYRFQYLFQAYNGETKQFEDIPYYARGALSKGKVCMGFLIGSIKEDISTFGKLAVTVDDLTKNLLVQQEIRTF